MTSDRIRLEVARHRRDRWADAYCSNCGARLAIADGPDAETAATDLATRNALARPCCPAWVNPQQTRLDLGELTEGGHL
jgi:hypothetical protein